MKISFAMLLGLAAFTACKFESEVPADAKIACSKDAHCFNGDTCDLVSGRCVNPKDLLAKACTSNAECDDDVFCNGAETCTEGRCADGDEPCVSSLSCVTIACVEGAGACDIAIDQSVCLAGEYCNSSLGCLPGIPCETDDDCQDASVCNGAERCVGFQCTGGLPPAVADDDTCTHDGCDDELGSNPIFHVLDVGDDGGHCTKPGIVNGICIAAKGGCSETQCGDGIVDLDNAEVCDDGVGGPCLDDCTRAMKCGDGLVEDGENCDDGDLLDTGNGCSAACLRYDVCGNGSVEALYEECDDANTVPGDGCDSCQLESGWICHAARLPCHVVVNDCDGQLDFTPCETDTAGSIGLDFWWDICLGGTCCGDLTCKHSGPHTTVPDTEQVECFDNSQEITCPDLANCDVEPFCGQDAQHGWDVTHLQSERFVIVEDVAGQPINTDSVSGLQWQGCNAGGPCGESPAPGMSWVQALLACNALEWGGYDDWRLPNVYELLGIMGLDYSFGAARTSFPGYLFAAFSSTPLNDSRSFLMSQPNGSIDYIHARRSVHQNSGVRCVRDPAPVRPKQRRARSEGATDEWVVTDEYLEGMWQGCSAGLTGEFCGTGAPDLHTWQSALAYCQTLTYGGFDDWLLPNAKDLVALTDYSRVNDDPSALDYDGIPAIHPDLFPATVPDFHWSSTTYKALPTTAAGLNFEYGWLHRYPKSEAHHVRCLRYLQ